MECRSILLSLSVALTSVAAAKFVYPKLAGQTLPIEASADSMHSNGATSSNASSGNQAQASLGKSILEKLEQLSSDASLSSDRQKTVKNQDLINDANLQPVQIRKINELLAEKGLELAGLNADSTFKSALFTAHYTKTPPESTRIIQTLISLWAATNPHAAWLWISENDTSGLFDPLRLTVFDAWLLADANAALLAASNLAPSPMRQQLMAVYAAFIAMTEPDTAFYFASNLTNENARRHALDSVVYVWALTDPKQVIAHLNALSNSRLRDELLLRAGPTITAQLTQDDPYSAMQWTDTLNEQQSRSLGSIAFQQWVNQDAQSAVNWLTLENSHDEAEPYMLTAATSLPYQNVDIALQLFPTMNTRVQIDMAAPIATTLYLQNPNDAQLWTNNLNEPAVQQSANRGILLASVNEDPEAAMQMALDYQGPDKTQVLVRTAVEVDQQHPGVLSDWLILAPLTSAQKSEITAALVQTPPD